MSRIQIQTTSYIDIDEEEQNLSTEAYYKWMIPAFDEKDKNQDPFGEHAANQKEILVEHLKNKQERLNNKIDEPTQDKDKQERKQQLDDTVTALKFLNNSDSDPRIEKFINCINPMTWILIRRHPCPGLILMYCFSNTSSTDSEPPLLRILLATQGKVSFEKDANTNISSFDKLAQLLVEVQKDSTRLLEWLFCRKVKGVITKFLSDQKRAGAAKITVSQNPSRSISSSGSSAESKGQADVLTRHIESLKKYQQEIDAEIKKLETQKNCRFFGTRLFYNRELNLKKAKLAGVADVIKELENSKKPESLGQIPRKIAALKEKHPSLTKNYLGNSRLEQLLDKIMNVGQLQREYNAIKRYRGARVS